MSALSEQPDLLRALGRSLDEEQAQHIEIAVHEAFLSVTWKRRFRELKRRMLCEVDLNVLRLRTHALRLRVTTVRESIAEDASHAGPGAGRRRDRSEQHRRRTGRIQGGWSCARVLRASAV